MEVGSVPKMLRRKCTPGCCYEESWDGCGAEKMTSGMALPGLCPLLCVGSCGLPLPWVWCLLTPVLVSCLAPAWSLSTENLVKHADHPTVPDHSQDREPVPAAGCSGWLHPATCLSPGSPICPCISVPSFSQDLPSSSLWPPCPATLSDLKTPLTKTMGSVTCAWAPLVCPATSPSLFLRGLRSATVSQEGRPPVFSTCASLKDRVSVAS